MNLNIELTEKQEHFLKLFAKNQYSGAKDNVFTHQPIHAVQTQRSIVVDQDYDYDKIVFVVPDWEYEEFTSDTLFKLVETFYEDGEPPIKLVSFDKAYDDGLIDEEGGVTVR